MTRTYLVKVVHYLCIREFYYVCNILPLSHSDILSLSHLCNIRNIHPPPSYLLFRVKVPQVLCRDLDVMFALEVNRSFSKCVRSLSA